MIKSCFPAILLSIALFSGCKTEDVLPTASLEASAERFDYNEGTTRVIAVLNGPVSRDLPIRIAFSGTAVLGTDFRASDTEIIVKRGSDRGHITLTGIPSTDTTIKEIQINLIPDADAYLMHQQNNALTLELQNCSLDRDGDGVPDCDDECPNIPGPPENNGCPWLGLIINEILYDPPAGINGDSNGDGVRQPQDDEFVELFNSNLELDISGYTISDDVGVRHVFPPGTIVPSKGAVVVFGGGNPTGTFGGSIVQTASTGTLSLNRGGDVITVRDNQGNVLSVFDINDFFDRAASSYTKRPDVTGGFERHSLIPEAGGRLFSPGTQLDGTPF
jgi:hypothetical protein